MQTIGTVLPTGKTLYAFPANQSLADWTTYRVAVSEAAAPNLGRYSASVNEVTSLLWVLFEGSTQPASWDFGIETFDLSVSASGAVIVLLSTGKTLYAFPENQSLADWTTYREAFTESTSPNLGKYSASLDPTTSQLWRLFEGASQPSSWDLSLGTFDLSESPSVADTCRVRFVATEGATGFESRVYVTTSAVGRQNDRAFLSRAYNATTDANGVAEIDLPWSSNPGVGAYRFRVFDLETDAVLHDRTCIVPDEINADYEDLEDA